MIFGAGADWGSPMFGVLAGPGWPKAPIIDDFLLGAHRESLMFGVLAGPEVVDVRGFGRPRLAQSPRHRRFSVGGRPGVVDL